MSVPRSARCLARQRVLTVPTARTTPASRRLLHETRPQSQSQSSSSSSSSNVPAKRPTRLPRDAQLSNPNYTLTQQRPDDGDMPLTREEANKHFPRYTEEELNFLRRKYTPEQMASIEAGENAVDPLDLLKQGVLRNDYMRVRYVDDFRNLDPVLDNKPQAADSNYDPDLRFKNDDEMDEDLAMFWEEMAKQNVPPNEMSLRFEQWLEKYRFTVGRPEAELNPPNYLAPQLGKLTDPVVKRTVPDPEDEYGSAVTDKAWWERLTSKTGLSREYIEKLQRKVVVSGGVANQTRMGKIRRHKTVMVVGNGNGLLGIGEGKSLEPQVAQAQAYANAVRGMRPVPRYEGRTIFGDTTSKVGATVVKLYNRPPGFGVRCQSKIFEMARCAGITDLAAEVPRGRNHMNTVKAAYEALMGQRIPDTVARGRGRKMVDVRKVYYAGMN